MALLDVPSPLKWGIFKIVVAILCLLILIGVFLPWFWVECRAGGRAGVISREFVKHYDSVGINDYPAAWFIIFSTLFIAFFLFLGYEIRVNIGGMARRTNELFPIMLAFLIFVYCVSLACKINEKIGGYSEPTTVAGKSITILGRTFEGGASVVAGVGAGFVIIAVSSFLLMIFSFLVWRQKSREGPSKTAEVQTVAPELSEEEIISAFSKIPRITPKKAGLLYRAGYTSISKLKSAKSSELSAIKGITPKDVKNIKELVL